MVKVVKNIPWVARTTGLLSGLILVILMTGCGLDDPSDGLTQDISPPSIEIVSASPPLVTGEVCGEPVGLRLIETMTGDNLHLDFRVRDDIELAQFKIDIHHNFDCHSHAKRAPDGIPWSQVVIRDIKSSNSDGSHLASEVLRVPENAKAGFYHLLIRYLDAAGNEAPYVELNLRVRNGIDTVPPTLILAALDSDTLRLARTDSLILVGHLQDNRTLTGAGHGRIEASYRDNEGILFSIGQWAADTTAFRIAYRFPPFLTSGGYTLIVEGFDAVNNVTRRTLYLQLSDP